MLTNHRDEGVATYERAWHLFSSTSGGSSDEASKRLGEPRRLSYSPPPLHSLDPHQAHPNCLSLTFTVTASGKVEDIRVVERTTANRTLRQLRLALLQSAYSPALSYGEPVARAVSLKQCFDGERPIFP